MKICTIYLVLSLMYRPGSTDQPIWFAPLNCGMSEQCLADCNTICPSNASNSCDHSQDVFLFCGKSIVDACL